MTGICGYVVSCFTICSLTYYLLSRNNPLTDGIAKPLCDFVAASKSLQALSLGRTQIGDDLLTALSSALSRRALDAAATVAARKQIEEAKRKKGPQDPLPYEDVGGVLYGVGNRTLTWIDLTYTLIQPTGLRALLEAATVNHVLTSLLLEHTPGAEQAPELVSELTQLLGDRNVPSTHRTAGSRH